MFIENMCRFFPAHLTTMIKQIRSYDQIVTQRNTSAVKIIPSRPVWITNKIDTNRILMLRKKYYFE